MPPCENQQTDLHDFTSKLESLYFPEQNESLRVGRIFSLHSQLVVSSDSANTRALSHLLLQQNI